MRVDTPPAVYIWDGKPANHPLRKLREGLGKDKAMRLAKEAGIDRLDINAVEKGKNKGNGAELVLRLAIPLFLTPKELFDLLHFQLDPDEALTRAIRRQYEGGWEQIMAGVRPSAPEFSGKSQLSEERRQTKIRQYADEEKEKEATVRRGAIRRGARARQDGSAAKPNREAAPPSKRRAAG